MSLDETALVEQLRAIATDPAARGLNDDVALLGELVLTHDTIAEGVHYLPSDPPASVGWIDSRSRSIRHRHPLTMTAVALRPSRTRRLKCRM